MKQSFQLLIYRFAMEDVTVNAVIKDETIWLTQKAMAELFSVQTPVISKRLQNIYDEGKLNRDTTVSKMETVQTEGEREVNRNVDFYNLDATISVDNRDAAIQMNTLIMRRQNSQNPIQNREAMILLCA